MVVKIDGNDLRGRKEKKSWAGWIPRFEDESLKFKRRVLCPGRVSGRGG